LKTGIHRGGALIVKLNGLGVGLNVLLDQIWR
jgi:hypothetical protein